MGAGPELRRARAGPARQWLLDLGMKARGIHRRHRWLADRVLTAPGTGPNTVDVVEHVLAVLEDHPADDGAQLVAFGVPQALVAAMAHAEHDPLPRILEGVLLGLLPDEGQRV